MSRTPRSFVITEIAGAILCLGILVAAWLVGISWHLARQYSLGREQRALTAELERMTRVAEAVTRAETQLAAAKAAREPLRETADFGEFYGALLAYSEAEGVRLDSVEPGALETADSFAALPVSISAQTNYESAAAFVSRILRSVPYCKIVSLSLGEGEETGTCALELELMLYAQPGDEA